MKRGQNGFGAVEGLLVLILLAILGFTGYYVYHSRNNTNSTYNNVAKTGSSTPATTKSTAAVPSTLTFTNFGVKITLNDALKGMTYTPDSQYPDSSDAVTVPDYATLAKSCDSSDTGNFGIVGKQDGTYDPSTAQLILLKQFSGFWISYTPALGNPCDSTSNAQQITDYQASLKTAITDAFKDATQVQ